MNDYKLKTLALVSKPDENQSPDTLPVFTFKASDGLPDRSGDRVFVSGWKLDSYKANPVVLLGHDDGSAGLFEGPRPVMPLGKANVYTTADALYAEITFDQDDPQALAAQRKVQNGFLNAVSVRFLPVQAKSEPNDFGGTDFLEQELLEISLVVIPANQRAVRVKSYEDQLEALANRVAELIVAKSLSVPAPQAETIEPTAAETAPESEAVAAPIEPAATPETNKAEVEKQAPGIDLQRAAAALADAILNQLNNP